MTASGGDRSVGTTPIRDAACLILIDRSEPEARVLMGRRQASQVFLPNKWVFPGGRVDDEDRVVAARLSNASRSSTDAASLMSFAIAALRETLEETGIAVGPSLATAHMISPEGVPLPGLDELKPLARAITPPGRPRRFDTWFFVKDWSRHQPSSGQPDGELLDLGWFTLTEVRALDLPNITRYIVDDVASVLAREGGADCTVIPFYYQDVDRYRRDLMEVTWPLLVP